MKKTILTLILTTIIANAWAIQTHRAINRTAYEKATNFKNHKDLPSRNSAIMVALSDGYTQGEIARYLDLSSAMVSHIFRSLND